MSDAAPEHQDLSAVALFPLPNVVLFPRAVLPLHIFEERYKAMIADALDGDRLIAMALLKTGWEKCYHGTPAIEPVVCVGTIISHEKLPDGNYNLLLDGHTRARVVEESRVGDRLYRMAQLEPLAETHALEIDLSLQRERLIAIFNSDAMARTCLAKQFRQLLDRPLPTQDVADLVAFYLLEDIALKQRLLAEPDVRTRVDQTLHALESVASSLPHNQTYVSPESIEYSLKHPDMN